MISLAQGGLCKLIGTEFCTFISNNADPEKGHLNKFKELQQQVRDMSKDGEFLFSWMGSVVSQISIFFSKILKPIVAIIVLIFIFFPSQSLHVLYNQMHCLLNVFFWIME